jgi:D-sedoheptulose 7-phosphate isomerase
VHRERLFVRGGVLSPGAGLGAAGDCLLAISTSGNSRNVIKAVEAARSAQIHTVGLLGRDGGALRQLCDMSVIVDSPTTARIQEAHIFIGTRCAAGSKSSSGTPETALET